MRHLRFGEAAFCGGYHSCFEVSFISLSRSFPILEKPGLTREGAPFCPQQAPTNPSPSFYECLDRIQSSNHPESHLVIAIFVTEVPDIQSLFGTASIPLKFWFIPLPLALGILIMDEMRKLIVRLFPRSLIAKAAW